ncbi:MAG: metallophosphoesterase [Pyrinomonadaceae bacterium]|nr:metallophosphoesterase [Pyrinomonadaceae bacterium]
MIKGIGQHRAKFYGRFGPVVQSNGPLLTLAQIYSQKAREAIAEANTFRVDTIKIFLNRLPKSLDGFRLVQLSDIHHSPLTSSEFIEQIVAQANELKPDLFVLTGDYVSHEPEYIAPVAKILGKLKSEYGIYACLGNHDHWTDAGMVVREFFRNNIQMLVNEGFRFYAKGESFWLCGVDDFGEGLSDIRKSLRGSKRDEMKLLLAHNPAIMRRAAYRNIDLVLSGHTHGGQVKLREPRASVLFPNRRRRFSSGLHYRGETQIYITRGIGTVVVPMRYQCPPEISLIELRATNI